MKASLTRALLLLACVSVGLAEFLALQRARLKNRLHSA